MQNSIHKLFSWKTECEEKNAKLAYFEFMKEADLNKTTKFVKSIFWMNYREQDVMQPRAKYQIFCFTWNDFSERRIIYI